MKIPVLSPYLWAAGALGLVAAIALVIYFLGAPGREASTAARARVDTTFAHARTKAAKDATTITSDAATGAAADEATTRNNHDAITSQPGAEAPVDPRVADAGRRAICLRHAARCSAACQRLLGPCPAGSDGRRSGS